MDKSVHFAIRNLTHTLWYQRNSHQRRAILFIVVFSLLLITWIGSGDSTVSGATILYKQISEPSWSQLVADVPSYHLFAVADNDEKNRAVGQASSRMRSSALAEGTLTVAMVNGAPQFKIEWNHVNPLKSAYIHDGRGLELSTLQFWNGARLFSCDDHTGIVYEIILEEGLQPRLVPRHILSDGDGTTATGMRCEWSASKGDFLLIGSTGHPWIDRSGSVLNRHSLWIKTISPLGVVKHIDWSVNYDKMKQAMGVGDDGYLLHECGLWSSKWNRWYFIPRHVSNTPYRPGDEHLHGSTAIIVADASFQRIVVNPLQFSSTSKTTTATAGVTDCKFIPNGRDREIVIIRTDESKFSTNNAAGGSSVLSPSKGKPAAAAGGYQTYVSVVNTDGAVLLEDVAMPFGWKFEGVELRPIIHHEK